jgi:hypothetical protein
MAPADTAAGAALGPNAAPCPVRGAGKGRQVARFSRVDALLVALLGLNATAALAAEPAAEPAVARLGPAAAGGGVKLSGGPGSLRLDFHTFSARFDLALPGADELGGAWRRTGWQLLGDYRFAALGGLRATGGLLGATASGSGLVWPAPVGPQASLGPRGAESAVRGQLWSRGLDSGLATYVGLGYSLGERPGGWGLSADLGLIAQRDPAEVRLGRSGTPGVDWLRELRLRPLLQVGASYAF